MEISDKEWTIPMEVNEQAIIDLGLNREDVVKMRIGCRIVDVIHVPCTKEQHDSYMHAEWNEAQRDYRSRKCMIVSEKTGKLIRCTKPCKDCPHMRSGSDLSLDLFEEQEYEPEDITGKTYDSCRSVLTYLLIDELLAKLDEQNPEFATIFRMLLDEASHKEISTVIGKPRQTTSDIVARLKKELQKFVSREDILG